MERRSARAWGAIVVVEEQRCEGPTHVPLHIVREQAEKDVTADPILQVMMDGPHLEVDRLETPERSLDHGQAFV
jgi:hypothetical protein